MNEHQRYALLLVTVETKLGLMQFNAKQQPSHVTSVMRFTRSRPKALQQGLASSARQKPYALAR